jgi:tetratricopeptide (TPR) repeat protein
VTGQHDKAIEILLKAEKLNPNDAVVLGNIAQGYKLKGDNGKAIEYYEKVVKVGDKETIAYAEEQIKELKKK